MGTFEHEWLQKNCDVQRSMKVGLHSPEVVPSLMPHFFTKSERLVGDGHAGTIQVTTLNPAMTGGVEKQVKERILVHDVDTGTMVWETEDPRFSKMTHTMKVQSSGANGEDVLMKWQMEYEPIDPATPPPVEAKAMHLEIMKVLQKYVDDHPEWP